MESESESELQKPLHCYGVKDALLADDKSAVLVELILENSQIFPLQLDIEGIDLMSRIVLSSAKALGTAQFAALTSAQAAAITDTQIAVIESADLAALRMRPVGRRSAGTVQSRRVKGAFNASCPPSTSSSPTSTRTWRCSTTRARRWPNRFPPSRQCLFLRIPPLSPIPLQ